MGGSGQSWCLLGLSPNCAVATEPRAVLRWPQLLLLLEELAWSGSFQRENQMCHAGEKSRDSKLVSLVDVLNNLFLSQEGLALSCKIKT